jgi:hypothetical protein
MIDVNRLILNGTRFTYGTELLHTFNNTKKLLLYGDFKKNYSALIETPKKTRG